MSKSAFTTRYDWERESIPLISTPFYKTRALDQYTTGASEMALVHNCIIRALNSIYIQAPHTPVSEYANFVHYCVVTHEVITSHHHGQEQNLFPKIERMTGEMGAMRVDVEQHKAYEINLAIWGNWLTSIEARKNNFSPHMCRSLMKDFMSPLAAHLHDEVATILALSRFGTKLDLKALLKAESDRLLRNQSRMERSLLLLLNHDVTFEDGWHDFPPLPGPLRWVLKGIYGRRKEKWWQFSAVGFDGRPRPRRFAGAQ